MRGAAKQPTQHEESQDKHQQQETM
jgi:hypothetical protein